MSAIRSIARATSREALQQPAVMLLIICGVFAVALIPLFQLHQFGEHGRLVRDSALAYQLTIGLLLATVTAGCAIHSEIVGGTAQAALAKPISRSAFLIGKFLGVLRVVGRFWLTLLLAMLAAERIPSEYVETSYASGYVCDKLLQLILLAIPPLALAAAGVLNNLRRVRFCVAACNAVLLMLVLALAFALLYLPAGETLGAIHFAPALGNLNFRIIPVSLLIFALLAVYAAIAAACSTRLAPAATFAICFVLLLLGLSAETPLGAPIPAVQTFWMCDAIAGGGVLPLGYLFSAFGYAAGFIAIALGVGMILFEKRDI